MKNILILIFALMSLGVTTSKENDVKLIKLIYNLNDSAEKKKFDTWVKNNVYLLPSDSIGQRYQSKKELKAKATLSLPCVYEDDKYEAYSYCFGEFGGYILFLSKKTNKIHITECTCYNMIIRQENSYFITTSLAHMRGNLSVFEIKNPSLLPVVDLKELKETRPSLWYKEPSDEARPNNILSKSGYIAHIFYPYKSNNYLIYSDLETLFIAKIGDKKLYDLDIIIAEYGEYNFASNNQSRIVNNIYEHYFSEDAINSESNNQLYIKSDTIVLGYHKRTNKK
jgi:hypothetical protein